MEALTDAIAHLATEDQQASTEQSALEEFDQDCAGASSRRSMPFVPSKTSRTFAELLADIELALSGDETEIETVREILASYKAHPKDFSKYIHFDPTKYTRNLVSDGNGKYNLLVLCWNVGHASPIHDHSNSHCFVKMLKGTLTETLYRPPSEVEPGSSMIPTSVSHASTNDVCYIDDMIGMHQMANESHVEGAISLHLYSPPYAECHIYDSRTGVKSRTGPMIFYSRGGVKL